MKKNKNTYLNLFACLVVFSGASCVYADEAVKTDASSTTSARPMVVRAVDPYRVLNGSVEFKEKSEKIQKEIDRRAAQVEGLKADVEKKTEELNAMKTTAAESALENKQKDILATRNNVQIETEALKMYVQNASERAQMEFLQTIQDALSLYCSDHGIDMVVGNGLLFVAQDADITQDVINFMNDQYAAKKKPASKQPAAENSKSAKK